MLISVVRDQSKFGVAVVVIVGGGDGGVVFCGAFGVISCHAVLL